MVEPRNGYERLDQAWDTLAHLRDMQSALVEASRAANVKRPMDRRIDDLLAYTQEQIVGTAELIQRMLEGDDLPF
jgi:hypothetical protein